MSFRCNLDWSDSHWQQNLPMVTSYVRVGVRGWYERGTLKNYISCKPLFIRSLGLVVPIHHRGAR